MAGILTYLGPSVVAKYYLVPYLFTNHWIGELYVVLFSLNDTKKSLSPLSKVMFTYLHHSDPTIPHYRKAEWSFLRGASATVDRPLMGWMGRFFLHNVCPFSRPRRLLLLTERSDLS
jgi:hypothetical protein